MMEASLMRHELCLCTGADALAQRTVPFVEEGFEAGEPVIAVLHGEHGTALRDGLGAGADALTLIDPDEHYSRPEAALASYDATLRRLIGGGAPGVRLVGELPTIRTAAGWDRWAAYDAILNRAFAHQPVWIVCVYDTETLPEHAVHAARCTHPVAFGAAGRPNDDYLPPDDVVRARTPATAPLDGLEALEVDGDGAELRRRLGVALDAAGVEPEDGGGMLLAVGEVYNNARRHAGGATAVRVGVVDGHFVCEVHDAGPGVEDPLAGFLPPRPGGGSGAGLWVARQATQQLETVVAPGGHAVRLWA
jgi:anti-sigma regulatory factor (Ser/Thr protein kinase)